MDFNWKDLKGALRVCTRDPSMYIILLNYTFRIFHAHLIPLILSIHCQAVSDWTVSWLFCSFSFNSNKTFCGTNQGCSTASMDAVGVRDQGLCLTPDLRCRGYGIRWNAVECRPWWVHHLLHYLHCLGASCDQISVWFRSVQIYLFPFFGHQAATNTLEVLKNDLPCHALQQNVTFNCPTVKCQTSNPNLLFQNAWTQNYRLLKSNMPVSQWFPPVFRFGAPLLHRGLQFQLLVCFAPGTKFQQNVASSLLPRRSPARKTENHLSYTIWSLFQKTQGFQTINQFWSSNPLLGKKNPSAMGNQSS